MVSGASSRGQLIAEVIVRARAAFALFDAYMSHYLVLAVLVRDHAARTFARVLLTHANGAY